MEKRNRLFSMKLSEAERENLWRLARNLDMTPSSLVRGVVGEVVRAVAESEIKGMPFGTPKAAQPAQAQQAKPVGLAQGQAEGE